MAQEEQSFANHARMVPMYHYGITSLVLVVFIFYVFRAAQDFSFDSLMMILLAVALLTTALFARIFPLGVQDRVIRLEERLRMEQILPEDLKARIGDFTTEQLIALRFATDRELPDMARRVLEEPMEDRKSIKQAIQVWRADNQRI